MHMKETTFQNDTMHTWYEVLLCDSTAQEMIPNPWPVSWVDNMIGDHILR